MLVARTPVRDQAHDATVGGEGVASQTGGGEQRCSRLVSGASTGNRIGRSTHRVRVRRLRALLEREGRRCWALSSHYPNNVALDCVGRLHVVRARGAGLRRPERVGSGHTPP